MGLPMESSRPKVIIVHGGAMKAAFSAGVLYGLTQKGLNEADVVVGTSASVPTSAYFMSRQFDDIRAIWTHELGNAAFVNYSNLLIGRPIFNLPYLIDTVFKEKYPLQVEQIVNSRGTLLIPVYNYVRGTIDFHSSKEPGFSKNIWGLVQAAITLHDRQISDAPEFHSYVDADLDPFGLYRSQALQDLIPQNAQVILISSHEHIDHTWKKTFGLFAFRLLQARHFPQQVKDMLRRRSELIATGLPLYEAFIEKFRPIIIHPDQSLHIDGLEVLTRGNRSLAERFAAGAEAAQRNVIL